MSQTLLDQLLPEPSDGFSLKDLPHLDDESAKLLSFIIRNNYVARKTIFNSLTDFLDIQHQTPDYLDHLLAKLVQKHQISLVEIDGELWYRPQIRRRLGQGDTLGNIWKALDESQTGEVNEQIRRTRSSLADSLLPDMRQVSATEASEEAQDTAKNLLSDLFSTARNSMKKHRQ